MVKICDKAKNDPKELYDLFRYTIGDVYVSDWMASVAANDRTVEKALVNGLNDFFHHKYGDISRYDADINLENNCFGGDLFGRYHTGDWKLPVNVNGEIMGIHSHDLVFKIRTYEGNTYVLIDSEFDWLIREEEKS